MKAGKEMRSKKKKEETEIGKVVFITATMFQL